MEARETMTPAEPLTSQVTPLSSDAPRAVLEVVSGLAAELHPQRRTRSLGLEASLERDFGFDSLGRVELLARLERRFGVQLPEGVLASAETPQDLLAALALGGAVSPADLAADGRIPEGEGPAPDLAEPAPERLRTLVEVLEWHADRHPERRHILYLPGKGPPEELTYGDLARRARAVAAGLAASGFERGGTVALMLPTSLDYFAAFFGIQLAGGVPVPLYPPARKSQIEDHLRRQAGILRVAETRYLITFQEVLALAHLLAAQLPDFRKVTTVAALAESTGVPFPARVTGDSTAFLQFTSGSTGNPKGVVLTHDNLLANLHAIGRGADLSPADVVVSWLPLYHDMGLIGAWMGSLTYAMPLVLLSPLTFLTRPARWLQAITRHRGTLSAAPNFAYELCAAKVPEGDLEGLDLSSWRMALNGAEPVSPDAIRRFTDRFAPHGFRPGSMAPVYGLAENSLALAFPPLGRPPRVESIDRDTFQRTGRAAPLKAVGAEGGEGKEGGAAQALRFVSCGMPLPTCEIRVVDDAERELPERQQGRVEFRGPSATAGYHRNPEATAVLVRGDWRDSGDLGYIAEGEVYLTGRIKDVIIRGGRNLYPHELEGAVGDLPGVRKGCVAVFGSPDPATGTERLVILAETRLADRGDHEGEREALRDAIQNVAVDLLGGPAEEVVLAPPNTVPKTSSGKVRRAASRELYESGSIGRRVRRGSGALRDRWGSSLGVQMARLAVSGLAVQARRRLRAAGAWTYAGWAALVVALGFLPGWALVVSLPSLAARRRAARFVARTLAFLLGIPLRLEGEEHLSGGVGGAGAAPSVVASNHQSYLDGVVLTALLPPGFAFVVKRELEGSFFSRTLLRRLGAVFVERFDPAQGQAEVRKALEAVRAGESLVIFVEGTFRRWPGLLPFRMGAFVLAAEAGVPIVPLALRGTRSILRGTELFLRRGRVEAVAAPPIAPRGDGWPAVVALRDEVRAAILARCGEPDLPTLE
jgi:1-acyl-sn-glycerol-3-phosphate acyltransferase